MAQMGVACVKLEGRMKRPEYVAAVTGIYRRLLDEKRPPTAEEQAQLERAFSRSGFTDGYWLGQKGPRMFGMRPESARWPEEWFAQVRKTYENGAENRPVPVAFSCRIAAGEAAALTAALPDGRSVTVRGAVPETARSRALTEDELRTIGELATRYDAIVIEDLAYLCMDFRKPLGRPFEAPYQASVARYTDNYILLVSGSKIFSYAGQRIAVAAISDALFRREYPALRRRYNIGRLGDAYVLVFLYAASSGTSHSAQHALAAMFRAAADGELDFVGEASEYARRARLTKETFLRHGFRIVYDKDRDEPVSDGFFYTVGYGAMTSAELLSELLLYGICAISLTSTGSRQSGIRVCVSQMNRPEQFEMLEERLTAFAENNR